MAETPPTPSLRRRQDRPQREGAHKTHRSAGQPAVESVQKEAQLCTPQRQAQKLARRRHPPLRPQAVERKGKPGRQQTQRPVQRFARAPHTNRSAFPSPKMRCGCRQASMFAYFAFSSMKARRGGTSSPISMEKMWSHAAAFSMVTRRRVRFSGFNVVSQSCSAFISPKPL